MANARPLCSLEFDARCERVYLLALQAMARRHAGIASPENLRDRLGANDARLRERVARPDAVGDVAAQLGLDADQLDWWWAVAAVSADPRIAPHAEALGGPHARRGLSLGVYAELTELGGERARALARWLAIDNPLIENGLISSAEDGPVVAARAFTTAPRVLGFLSGVDEIDPLLRRREARGDEIFADNQRAALAVLERALQVLPPPVVIIEGPSATGRRTAVAHAARRRLAVLDERSLAGAPLAAGLLALRREVLLDGAMPVIAGVDGLARDAAAVAAVARVIDALDEPVVLTARDGGGLTVSRPAVRVRWVVPDVATRRVLWQRHAGQTDERGSGAEDKPPGEIEGLEQLALRYPLGPTDAGQGVRVRQCSPRADSEDARRRPAPEPRPAPCWRR